MVNTCFARSISHAVLVIGIGLSAVACGGSLNVGDSGDGSPGDVLDAISVDAAPDVPTDVPFETAMHNPLPQIPLRGGPTMSHVQLVVITYADDPNRAQFEAFGHFLGTSNWLATVGADYGVGPGTVLGVVERTDNAPDAISSTDIESMLVAGVVDGSIPSPADHDYSNVLYMVFYPSHTTISLVTPGQPTEQSCQAFGGYHSEVRRSTLHLSYAAVPDCSGSAGASDFNGDTNAASHEYIEAATDPFPLSHPGYTIPPTGASAWSFIGGEVGDLCELVRDPVEEGGYVLQRCWSNSAAAADHDPCVPADTTRPYFNVSVGPDEVQFASSGDVVTFTLTGWSLVPMDPWSLTVIPQGGNVMAFASVSPSHINNGGTSTVTVRIPSSAPSGYASFLVSSASSNGHNHQQWPIAVLVN